MQAISDSINIVGSKAYLRFYTRDDATGGYLPLSFQFKGFDNERSVYRNSYLWIHRRKFTYNRLTRIFICAFAILTACSNHLKG